MRMGEDGMPKKILLKKPRGYREVRHPRLRWLDNVPDDLAKGWSEKLEKNPERELWCKTTEEAKAHLGLLRC
jgi:hypothetical protein